MRALRAVLAAAGFAGTVFFAFCAWALWGAYLPVAIAAGAAGALCLGGAVWLILAGRPPREGQVSAPAASPEGEPERPARPAPSPAPAALCSGTFLHVSGLDLPEGVKCALRYEPDRLRVSAMGHDFTLAHEKVRAAGVLTCKDVQRQYVSSAGGAVAGAMLLGPLGAALGGGVHRKNIRTRERLLVFAYGGADEPPRYLIFRTTQWGSRGREFASAHKKRLPGAVTQVEL